MSSGSVQKSPRKTPLQTRTHEGVYTIKPRLMLSHITTRRRATPNTHATDCHNSGLRLQPGNLPLCRKYVCVLFAGDTGVLPRFVTEPQSQIIKPGDAAILTCAVEPNNAVVQWTFNGRTLSDASRRRGRSRDDDDDDDGVVVRRRGFTTHQRPARNEHSLRIGAFDVSRHEGVYHCLATSSLGSLLSRPAALEPAGTVHTPFHFAGS